MDTLYPRCARPTSTSRRWWIARALQLMGPRARTCEPLRDHRFGPADSGRLAGVFWTHAADQLILNDA